MTDRARVLKVGGALLGLLIAGLVVGFLLTARDKSPSPNSSPTPATGDTRTQIEQAYLRYWDVYADALISLDTSSLNEVLTGDALENVRRQVADQRSKNEPVRVRVEHDYRILIVDQATASVEDTYINHTVRVDPQTKQPTEPDPNDRVRRTYTMKKVDGVWKVSNIIGFRSGSPSP